MYILRTPATKIINNIKTPTTDTVHRKKGVSTKASASVEYVVVNVLEVVFPVIVLEVVVFPSTAVVVIFCPILS